MRVVFAGTPAFAVAALAALRRAGHDIALVLTQPDRPAGRGLAPRSSPVKAHALAAGYAVFQPVTLKEPAVQSQLAAVQADVMVVAAYGLILPPAVLSRWRYGGINIHASLLPRWRGAAPIHRAILAGDTHTGICIMQMEAGLDTGPVWRRECIPIEPNETTGQLHDRLALLGGTAIATVLAELATPGRQPTPQASDGVTYAAKLEKAEAWLNWRADAVSLTRQVRAFNPFPGAKTRAEGIDYTVWEAIVGACLSGLGTAPRAAPGTLLAIHEAGLEVACTTGSVVIQAMQRAGSKRMLHADFLHGSSLRPGHRFESPD